MRICMRVMVRGILIYYCNHLILRTIEDWFEEQYNLVRILKIIEHLSQNYWQGEKSFKLSTTPSEP